MFRCSLPDLTPRSGSAGGLEGKMAREGQSRSSIDKRSHPEKGTGFPSVTSWSEQ